MNPVLETTRAALYLGDSRKLAETFGPCSVDAVVSDPPYELGFMGKKWDASGIAFDPAFWRGVLEVMKPGAFMLTFGGTRTSHRMVCAIEDAGFEVRDSIEWLYGTGFPKSLNLGEGRGTALKPGHEPICLAMKPLAGTFAANLATHGTGALNIDACAVGTEKRINAPAGNKPGGSSFNMSAVGMPQDAAPRERVGRWPANVLLDPGAAEELDAQTADLRVGGSLKGGEGRERPIISPLDLGPRAAWQPYGDSGGASRFFYVAKPGRAERDLGCEHLAPKTAGEMTDRTEGSDGLNSPRAGAGRTAGALNHHPTVKPVTLLRYLVRLITPPGGLVLDPFAGSGSTGVAALAEGREFLGVELTPEYAEIAKARLEHALKTEAKAA